VLICVDQWRGDCLGCAGHPVVETPYLDQFASTGARFDRAYSATPSCIPARAALYTGMGQRSTGRVGYQDGVPFDYPVTLPGEFTRHGYQTQAVGKLHVYPERSQIGFQNVVLHDGYLHYARRRERDWGRFDDYLPWLRERTGDPYADYFDNGVNCNSQVARPWDKPEHLHPTTWVVTQALEFLRRRDERKPFFLYLGFHRPHPPYDPPGWAFEQYRDAPMPVPPVGDWAEEVLGPYETPDRADPTVARLTSAKLQRARAGYFGHMTHIDHQINRFCEALAEFGVGQNTYVCFVSDHGEMLGDHHAFRKSLPYEGSARVPFLLWGPRDSGIQAGRVIGEEAAVVELRNVMPTLLDCAGLPIPDSVEGKSVLPLARGESVSDWRPHLHGEHTAFGQSLHWITDGREKYVWWSGSGREQLFDLRADPTECHDLSTDTSHASRLARWRETLSRELVGREEGFVDASGRLVAGRPVRPTLTAAHA
jgi:arylsulfatase A-like enzyme